MQDCFHQDVTPEQLRAWDIITASYDQTVWDAEVPADRIFWDEDCPGLTPELVAGKRVLELGCGMVRCAPYIIGANGHYTGLDRSRLAVQASRGRLRRWGGWEMRHTVWDAANMVNEEFDIIFGTYFAIHQRLEQANAILAAAGRWLRQGGLLSWDFWTADGPAPVQSADWPVWPQTEDVLRSVLGSFGFGVVAVSEPVHGGCRQTILSQKVRP